MYGQAAPSHYRDIIPSAGTTGSLLNLRARAQHYMRDIRIEVIQ
jgi:D-alanyl-D-alanine carboxypeptidase